jgi:hypothetical protein
LDPRKWYITTCVDQFCWNLISTWWFISLQFFSSGFTREEIGPDNNDSAAWNFSLPNIINSLYIQYLTSCSSIRWKYCGNLQVDQNSHLLVSYL